MFKYNSIQNHYNSEFIEKSIEKAKLRNIDSALVLTEKIDGSNIGIVVEGDKITIQSRNQVLQENAVFGNFQEVLERNNLAETLKEIVEQHFGSQKIIFFGEIFGGQYGNQKSGILIQRRINYCPKNEIFFFDIAIVKGEKLEYLSFCELEKICTIWGLPLVPILKIVDEGDFESSLKTAIGYYNTFETQIPGTIERYAACGIIRDHKFDMHLEHENMAEGFVIRPYHTDFFVSDCDRFIIKSKSEKFGEKAIKEVSQIADTIPIKSYITENRVRSAYSKFPQNANYGDIIREVFADIFSEYERDTNSSIDGDTRKTLQKRHSSQVFGILKSVIG